jgi:hypothetical protein
MFSGLYSVLCTDVRLCNLHKPQELAPSVQATRKPLLGSTPQYTYMTYMYEAEPEDLALMPRAP